MRALKLTIAAALVLGASLLLSDDAHAECEPGDPGEVECDTLIVGKFRHTTPLSWTTVLWNAVDATIPDDGCKKFKTYIDILNGIDPDGNGGIITDVYPWRLGLGLAQVIADHPEQLDQGDMPHLIGIQEIKSGCLATGQTAADHCFRYQVDTPGYLYANPDPSMVRFETWFWLEGLIAGDQPPFPDSNVIPRILDSSTQSTGGVWTWPDIDDTDPPMTDGIWLVEGNRLHVSGIGDDFCGPANIGRLLFPRVNIGGEKIVAAQTAFRPMLMQGDRTYDVGQQSIEYTIDTDAMVFDGDLVLGPYLWDFRDGNKINRSWGKGGAGLAPPTGPNPDYRAYAGKIRNTFEHHGRFRLFVEIVRTFKGDFLYNHIEKYTYKEEWQAPPIPGTWSNGGGAWLEKCPSGEENWDLAPALCQLLESRRRTSDSGIGTPPEPIDCEDVLVLTINGVVDPSATSGTETPGCSYSYSSQTWDSGGLEYEETVGIGTGPIITCASVEEVHLDGVIISSSGTENPACSYSWSSSVTTENRYRWTAYYECHDLDGKDAVDSVIDSSAMCRQQHKWDAPALERKVPITGIVRTPAIFNLDHRHILGYGAPVKGLPVRRGVPRLVPDP